MAFPSNVGSKAYTLDSAWQAIQQRAGSIKSNTSSMRAAATSSNVSADSIYGFSINLANLRADIVRFASTPGIAAYAQSQLNDNTFDLVAAYNAMIAGIDATINWIQTNFPKDGSGYLLVLQFDGNGKLTVRQFTPAQLTGFVTQLDALLATID